MMNHIIRFKHYEMSRIFRFKNNLTFNKYIENHFDPKYVKNYDFYYFKKNPTIWNLLGQYDKDNMHKYIQEYENENVMDILEQRYNIFPLQRNFMVRNGDKEIEIFNFYGKMHAHYLHLY